MKSKALKKVAVIHQKFLVDGTHQKLLAEGVPTETLKATFGLRAAKKMIKEMDQERAIIQTRAALSWFVTARADNSWPHEAEIWIYANLDPKDTVNKSLAAIFPGLRTQELRKVRENLAESGFSFKGNRIQGYNERAFKSPSSFIRR